MGAREGKIARVEIEGLRGPRGERSEGDCAPHPHLVLPLVGH